MLLCIYCMRNHGLPLTLVILPTKTLQLCNSFFFLQYEKPRSSFDVSYPSDQNFTIMLLFFYNMRNHGFPMTLVILLTKTLKLCNSSCFHRMRNHGLPLTLVVLPTKYMFDSFWVLFCL